MEINLVLTLLQASVTGAGLVLAVYALIIPLSDRIFRYRIKEISDEVDELKKEAEKTGTSISQDDIRKFRNLLDGIETRKDFPSYLSLWTGLSFLLFVLSALMSLFWIVDILKSVVDYWLPFTFFCSIILFLIVGLNGISDISQTMKREFEQLKREKGELEESRRKLEEFKAGFPKSRQEKTT
jgi:cobalamin biosynthesis protein CobD/CbiB